MKDQRDDTSASPKAEADAEIIPVVEEELLLDKRKVATGKVRVRTVVDVIDEIAKASLDADTVEVERIPVGRTVDHVPEIRTEDGVTIIPIMEEILVVEKRLMIKEELHVRKRTTTEEVEIPLQRRKQRAIVERIPAEEEDTTGKSS